MTETTTSSRRPADGAGTAQGRRARPLGLHGRRRANSIIIFVVLLVIAISMVVPFVWMALTAVRSPTELAKVPMPLLPESWHLENFAETLSRAPFGTYARNSLILAGSSAVLNVVFASACGYSLAKMRFRGAKPIFGWMVGSLMVPFYATVIPVFLMVRHMPLFGGNNILGQGGIGWIDSWWALIVPSAVTPFMIFLCRQFFVSTPTELMEASRIDGVGELGIFARIMAPQIRPGLLTVGLLSFEAGWNNFLWPLLVTTRDDLRVIQVGISSFRQEATTEWNLLMAGTTMAAIPMIILFIVFQRFFVQGFVSSGIK